MKIRTHFTHRIDMLDAAGELQEHLAGVEDYILAEAVWREAIARGPGATIVPRGLFMTVAGHSAEKMTVSRLVAFVGRSRINRLPAALRCYAGCAAKLYGDIDTADLVKIHIRSGKLTLLFYDDFSASPLPRLRERVKINMRTQRIDFFQHSSESEPQLLYLKSRYMTPNQDGYNQQKVFDDDLIKLGLFDFSGYGPTADVLNSGLANIGYAVQGFHLQRVRSSSELWGGET